MAWHILNALSSSFDQIYPTGLNLLSHEIIMTGSSPQHAAVFVLVFIMFKLCLLLATDKAQPPLEELVRWSFHDLETLIFSATKQDCWRWRNYHLPFFSSM